MPDTTYEEALRCPKCEMPGVHTSTKEGQRRGQKVQIITCDNDRCKWYQTSWIITINADGTMPIRKKGEKDFDADFSYMDTVGRHHLEQTMIELQGEEAYNPHSLPR